MRILGPNTLLKEVLEKNLCIGCGGCVGLCPYFKTFMGKTAMVFPCDLDKGRCQAHCPKSEVDLDHLARLKGDAGYSASPIGASLKVLAARAGKRWEGKTAQSGGTVSALMAFALEQGLIDTAVLTGRKGLEPVPDLVTTPESVAGFATSKYTAAPTLSALNRAIAEGRKKIGVVATPCQATAVAQLRGNPLQLEPFTDPVALVVGLFCTWAIDTRKLASFLSDKLDPVEIRKMDIPPPPAEVFTIDTANGRIEVSLSEIRHMVPEGCRICPDMTAEWADLSVGVFEGEAGWNTLIVRTAVGESVVREAVEKGWLVTKTFPEDRLSYLQTAAGNKKRRAFVKMKADGIINTAPEDRPSALRVAPGTAAAIMEGKEVTP